MYIFIFFFSSRRRHTIWTGDWSSDVCSSDLSSAILACIAGDGADVRAIRCALAMQAKMAELGADRPSWHLSIGIGKIGRASCRERGEMWEGGGGCVEKGKMGSVGLA